MKSEERTQLFKVRHDIVCTKCGCKGGVKYYGTWYPNGIPLPENYDQLTDISKKYFGKQRDKPYMSSAIGPGGTIPWECLNCGNIGLIDIKGLEGYGKAFETIKDKEEETEIEKTDIN